VDDLWATKSEEFGLIVRAVSFQDFQPVWSCGGLRTVIAVRVYVYSHRRLNLAGPSSTISSISRPRPVRPRLRARRPRVSWLPCSHRGSVERGGVDSSISSTPAPPPPARHLAVSDRLSSRPTRHPNPQPPQL